MVIGISRKLSDLPSDFSITIYESQIENTVNEKLLEVGFDQSLNWFLHIDSMCKKISQRTHLVSYHEKTSCSA